MGSFVMNFVMIVVMIVMIVPSLFEKKLKKSFTFLIFFD